MKKPELEQLANRLIDIANDLQNLNKPEDFVKGRWYKHKHYNIYAKYSGTFNNICFNKGLINNYIAMTDISLWRPVTDFTELTELLKAEVIKRIGKGKPIGVRDVEKTDYNNEFSGYFTKEMSKDFANELGNRVIYDSNTDTLYCYGEGITIVYENGVFATVANDMQAKLEEAKLKYPIGTEFKSVLTGAKRKVYKGIGFSENYDKCLFAIDAENDTNDVIYDGDTDTWAEIIPQDKGAVLIEKAKKMGFKGDVCIESMKHKEKVKLTYGCFIYEEEYDNMHFGGQMIYNKGIWATIIKEPIIIDGKEVEIFRNDVVDINGVWISKTTFKALQSLNPIFTEILKRMEEKNGNGNQ